MKVKKSLNFIYEKEDFLLRQFNICKKHVHSALEGIYETVIWLRSSIFKNVINDLTCYITDEPINFPGELAIDDVETFEPVIYINIMSITECFQNKEYTIDLKQDHATSFEYASFVLLHEVGHYVHALIGGSGKDKKERLYDYFDKGEYYYERFLDSMTDGTSHKEKKKYRNIPHEKAADNFARQYVNLICLNNNGEY
ncbi:hypothetical protein JCM9140_838 [Halalkalibacter wakoensis JCM 9140]|uniref:Uncharacterized protein n=1 Tax=Halalkalibacter wakoensis JCM 9140 TaxID=1236970 RepID=W4PYG7_9BACI|nr:hypothetical protein [Halalkalibacter wakoensis]GAE24876.1 hypothetical protein JCM9140_838 [Halalkalibacter wakoensis JCM 9140]